MRGCGLGLAEAAAGGLVCPRGHRFDRARSGYVNLLQPQDRRSAQAGDAAAAVDARRRTLARGLGAPLLEALVDVVAAAVRQPGAAALDVGCGDGTFLGGLAARLGLEAWGVDLSTRALVAAARAFPACRFVAANADRRLPFADGAFALVLSVTARQNPAEFQRILAPDGRLVVVVPDDDDLAELRAAVLGDARPLGMAARATARFAEAFALTSDRAVRSAPRLPVEALEDLFASTYRGLRHSQRDRLAALSEQAVTVAQRLLVFAPRRAAAVAPPRGAP